MIQTAPQKPVRLTFDRGTLILTNATREELVSSGCAPVWQWDHRVDAWRCDALHYAEVRKRLGDQFTSRMLNEVPAPASISWPKVELPAPRDEQSQALDAWMQANCRGQIIMPTGVGKTEVALAAMAQIKTPTLVVAPIRDLMYQWHRRIFKAFDVDAGIVGDNLFNLKPVTVTTYDSAYIHMNRMGADFDLLIFDEVHHLPGKCRREAAILSTAPRRLGLTATPERSDDRHHDLDWLVGPVCYHLPMSQVKGNTLADFDVVRVPVALDQQEQKVYDDCSLRIRQFIKVKRQDAPKYNWQDLCRESGTDPEARKAQKAFYRKQSIEDRAAEKLRILEDLFRLHADLPIIVFTGSNAMAIDVSLRFLVPTILSHTGKRERLAVLEGFAQGRFPVLVANRVLDEGIDVPDAKVAVVLGGQASIRQAKQRLGRILRKSHNQRALLYEVVCENTTEVQRSRKRRRSDAYQRTRHRRI